MVDTLQEAVVPETAKESLFVEITVRQFIFVLLIGIIVGILTWGLSTVVATYVLHPLMCGQGAGERCGGVIPYAEILATIIASGVGLFGLVRLQVFRPLLVALASAVALWGIVGYTNVLFPWYGVLLASALFYGISYLVFMWMTRIRYFWAALILLVALIIGIRLLFS